MFCSKCGTPLKDGARFCTKCGAEVNKEQLSDKGQEKQQRVPIVPQKKKSRRWSGMILLSLIVLAFACGGAIYLIGQEENNFLLRFVDRFTEDGKRDTAEEIMSDVIQTEPSVSYEEESIEMQTKGTDGYGAAAPSKETESQESESLPETETEFADNMKETVGTMSQEDKIDRIRDIYYGINQNPESLKIEQLAIQKGYAYNRGWLAQLCSDEEVSSETSVIQNAVVEFYYYSEEQCEDIENSPAFIFVTNKENGDEYRLYFYDGECIRYIDPDGNEKDFSDVPDTAMAEECYKRAVFLNNFYVQGGEYILENSSDEYLTYADVMNLDKFTLKLARNEIFARHGRKFKTAVLEEYFSSKSWYYGYLSEEQFSDTVFNDMEKKNILLIQEAEKD